MNTFISTTLAAVVMAGALFAGVAQASVTQRIEPPTIERGEAARLTISASGDDASAITPPMVSGLEFLAVAQSQQVESINGVSNSTTSITYQVIPQQAGVFTIPGVTPGSAPVVLTVNSGPGQGAVTPGGSTSPNAPQTRSGALPAGSTRVTANGTAFVRLRLSKHELYVGETIPVDIQVGMRDGFVASLNGLPTLNGDAFTLNPLSAKPQSVEEVIDGKPFTVLTWHSSLAAVKPGPLSLTIETPLTVRMRTGARPESGLFGQAGLDDLFDDPAFQNFFGASTEKDITVASAPTAFTVLALPTNNRPADFSGAVGNFSIASDVSDDKAVAGDPVTLRLRVSGSGNFDRVATPMLHDVEHWKTYTPTAQFKAQDDIGYRGEKIFEQPVIATQSGTQSLPPLTFSWFDPTDGHYVVAHTSPLRVAITASPTGSSVGRLASTTPNATNVLPTNDRDSHGLRPDHVDNGDSSASLVPHYYQPKYIALPSLLLTAFSGAWFWVRRREQSAAADAARGNEIRQIESWLGLMNNARASNDSELFLKAARAALQMALATKWQLAPDKITLDELDARLGAESDIARVFRLADETAYSGEQFTAIDFKWWQQMVLRHINIETMS
jgi:hypothetical protein